MRTQSGPRADAPARSDAADRTRTPPLPLQPRRPAWEAAHGAALALLDLVLLVLSWLLVLVVQDVASASLLAVGGERAHALPLALYAVPWVAMIGLSRGYEPRVLGSGSEEFKRLFNASVAFTALVGTTAFLSDADLSRGFVGTALPVGLVLLLLGRCVARTALHGLRRAGRAQHRCVVIGTVDEAVALTTRIHQAGDAGMRVVGVCLPDRDAGSLLVGDERIPVLGPAMRVGEVLAIVEADTVAVAGGGALSSTELRQLSWQLEGKGIDLALAPGLTDVAGPRVHVRHVAGLPLLHVEEPSFGGVRRVVKTALDLLLGLVLLTVLAPLMLTIAFLIRREDGGPVFYRQERVGRAGKVFRIWKFRSMHVGADALLDDLVHANESKGPLFKIRKDPRLTRTGARIRRASLDELPQLFNVVLGSMSLVGPRPPLQSEVDSYADHVYRRLLVKPGMTGLWQVSGRADLGWDEGVRLDLYYVENWSVAFDLMILWKTMFAVLRGRGAY